jgi:hypothetical protein
MSNFDERPEKISTVYANAERAIYYAGILAAERKRDIWVRYINYSTGIKQGTEYTLITEGQKQENTTNFLGVYRVGKGFEPNNVNNFV